MSIRSTVIIHKEENWYVAQSVETGVASQGKTIDEAIENLREALELYFEDIFETSNKFSKIKQAAAFYAAAINRHILQF